MTIGCDSVRVALLNAPRSRKRCPIGNASFAKLPAIVRWAFAGSPIKAGAAMRARNFRREGISGSSPARKLKIGNADFVVFAVDQESELTLSEIARGIAPIVEFYPSLIALDSMNHARGTHIDL